MLSWLRSCCSSAVLFWMPFTLIWRILSCLWFGCVLLLVSWGCAVCARFVRVVCWVVVSMVWLCLICLCGGCCWGWWDWRWWFLVCCLWLVWGGVLGVEGTGPGFVVVLGYGCFGACFMHPVGWCCVAAVWVVSGGNVFMTDWTGSGGWGVWGDQD